MTANPLHWPYEDLAIDRDRPRPDLPLTARPSEDFALRLRIVEQGQRFDLAGWTASLVVKPNYDHPDTIATISGNVDSATKGYLSFDLERTSVAALPAGRWVYTIVGTNGDGDKREFARGSFTILGDAAVDAAAVAALVYPYKELAIDRDRVRRDLELVARHSEDLNLYFAITEQGARVDLTGYTVRLVVKPTYTYATAIVTITAALDSAADGYLSVTKTREDVDGYAAGRWVYVLVGTDGSGNDREFARGPFLILGGAWS